MNMNQQASVAVAPAASAREPSVFVDPSWQREFTRDGVLVVDLLSREELARLRAVYDRFPEQHRTAFSASICSRSADYRRTVHAALGEILEPKLEHLLLHYRIFMCGFLAKQPSQDSAGEMPLHQDLSLVDECARPPLSIWCPLVDVDETNGCVEVVRGSHELNRRPRAPGTPFAYPHLEPLIRERYLEPLPMRAGQGLFLHHGTIHSSAANHSSHERPVAAAVFAPNEAGLVYYHRLRGQSPQLEKFAVDEAFYLRHPLGTRPEGSTLLGGFPEDVDPLSAEQLEAVLSARR
jgi:hypothetical protein